MHLGARVISLLEIHLFSWESIEINLNCFLSTSDHSAPMNTQSFNMCIVLIASWGKVWDERKSKRNNLRAFTQSRGN